MKKWFFIAMSILSALAVPGTLTAAAAADKLENIPLQWTPTSPMSERDPVDIKGLEGVKLQVDAFTDKREEPELIGRNVNKVPARKVTTKDDVPRFVTYEVKQLLSGLGLDVVEMRITVMDPAGKILWMVDTTGTSNRFGIGYKAANYHEVLSDALIGAVHELVRNPHFKKVLTEN